MTTVAPSHPTHYSRYVPGGGGTTTRGRTFLSPDFRRWAEKQGAAIGLTYPLEEKIDIKFVDEPQTANWRWNSSGHHMIRLFAFDLTMDAIPVSSHAGTPRLTCSRHQYYSYALRLLEHEGKGHAALTTRDLSGLSSKIAKARIDFGLLNEMEDARIEGMLRCKRPANTISGGAWLNHEGMDITIPEAKHGGDYGWRKADWWQWNLPCAVHTSPSHLLSGFVWAEKTKKRVTEIRASFLALWEGKDAPSEVWGRWGDGKDMTGERAYARIDWYYRTMTNKRVMKKTEDLFPLLERWNKDFPPSRHIVGIALRECDMGPACKDDGGEPLAMLDGDLIPLDELPEGGGGGAGAGKPGAGPVKSGEKESKSTRIEEADKDAPEAKAKISHDAPSEGVGEGTVGKLDLVSHDSDGLGEINLDLEFKGSLASREFGSGKFNPTKLPDGFFG